MTCFLSHHELENLYYMYGRYEETYQALIQRRQELMHPELQVQLDEQIEIVKDQQRQMLSSLT